MTSFERYITLVAGVLAILGTLLHITWQMGTFVQQFKDHVTQDDRIHADIETRMRAREQPTNPPRRRP